MKRQTVPVNSAATLPGRLRRGFTLLELLVVVSILAVVAGTVMLSLEGTEEQAAAQVSQHELAQLRQAVLRFYQDTGWMPGQGPFALVGEHPLGQLDPNNPLHWPPHLASATPAQRAAWARHGANWWQLLQNPLVDRNGTLIHPLGRWNPTTRRGWRGPYLGRDGGGLVDVSGTLTPSGDGDPGSGTSADLVPGCLGVADPWPQPPQGPFYQWYDPEQGTPRARWGRPYLLLDVHHTDPLLLRSRARIVSLGPNGRYESSATAIGGDDQVIYLFR